MQAVRAGRVRVAYSQQMTQPPPNPFASPGEEPGRGAPPPDPGTQPSSPSSRRKRPNRDAFLRSGVIALILFGVLGLIAFLGIGELPPGLAGRFLGSTILPFLVVSVIARLSRRRWGWVKHALVFLPVFILFLAISQAVPNT